MGVRIGYPQILHGNTWSFSFLAGFSAKEDKVSWNGEKVKLTKNWAPLAKSIHKLQLTSW